MYHSMLRTRKAVVAAAAGVLTLVAAQAATAQSDPIKCQQAISAAAQKYEDARAKTIQKCEEAKVKGKLPLTTECGATTAPPNDQKTLDKITSADGKRAAAIAKSCGGANKQFGGGDDIALSAINWDGRVPACDLGERDGLACQTAADCPARCVGGLRDGQGVNCPVNGALNSSCPSSCVGVCVGGSANGQVCASDSTAPDPNTDCPGGTCGSAVCVGGTNNGLACSNQSGCPGNNPCEQSNGCGAGKVVNECPDIEKEGCSNALTTLADIDTCVKCTSETGADQVVDSFYAFLTPTSTDKALEKCKQAIGKNAVKFFSTHRKALAGCQKNALKNAAPNTCPDTKASDKINKARTKLGEAIAKACGGADKAFGGGDDLTPDAIGAPLTCPNVDPPGALPSCYDFITTAQDIATCAACLADYKAIVLDAVAVPADDPTPTELNPLCGNGKFDAGESCDDGNVVDGDACPGNCSIVDCAVTGSGTVTVSFTDPSASVEGITIYLDYPEAKVKVPGSGSSIAVQNAVAATNGVSTPNDLDYAIRTLVTDAGPLPAGAILDITVQRCGALPAPSEFNCRVESATAAGGVSVFGPTCSVTAVN